MRMKTLNKFIGIALLVWSTLSVANNTDLLYGIYYGTAIDDKINYVKIFEENDHGILDNNVLSDVCFLLFKSCLQDTKKLLTAAYFLEKSYAYNNHNSEVVDTIYQLSLDQSKIRESFNQKYGSLQNIVY